MTDKDTEVVETSLGGGGDVGWEVPVGGVVAAAVADGSGCAVDSWLISWCRERRLARKKWGRAKTNQRAAEKTRVRWTA